MATVQDGATAEGHARFAMAPARLRGWKEIGRHFGVTERTVKRWEAERGMPVHRVPGEPRAPVFAYADELSAWFASGSPEAAAATAVPVAPVAPVAAVAPLRPRWALKLALALLLLAGGAALWLGVKADADRRAAEARLADVRQLARSQVAAVSDQLERQPGTVKLRAALAKEAAEVLGRVAALPDATPELKREAAEAYRRLAIVENALDRPSLRDRTAARAALGKGLGLLEGDTSEAGRLMQARLQIEAARQAGSDGATVEAAALLDAAAPLARNDRGELRDDYWLARSELQGWDGDYAGALMSARRVEQGAARIPARVLTQVRALELAAEAQFYAGELAGALADYRVAVATADAGLRRWPDDRRLQWALQRGQWNLGSTLIDMRRPVQAVTVLTASREGWVAMARADPDDEAITSWLRATRMSRALALGAAGMREEAITEMSAAVAERRQWLAAQPGDPERQRALVKGLASLGDVLAPAGRQAEACALYAEAGELVAAMARADVLTGNDRSSMVALLAQSETRNCSLADRNSG